MKESNYCSLEISKKLVDAGIEIETDAVHYLMPHTDRWGLEPRSMFGNKLTPSKTVIPAPTFAEIWAELPDEIQDANGGYYMLIHSKEVIWYYNATKMVSRLVDFRGTSNLANAAAELLIWVKEEKI